MRRILTARLRAYARAALSGKGRQGQLVRLTAALAAVLGVLGLVLLIPTGIAWGLVLLEAALLIFLVGFVVIDVPARGNGGGTRSAAAAKPKKSRVASPELSGRLSALPGVLSEFRALAVADPLPASTLPPVLRPLPAKPLVTVVVPAFNEEAFLEVAVRSVLKQTWATVEVVVVDDGSFDRTSAIIAKLEKEDARVRHVRHSSPRGLSAARNAGISRARGDLLVFLDGDDALHPTALQQRVAALLDSDLRVTVGSSGGCARVPSGWKPQRWQAEPRRVGIPTSIWTVGVRSPFAVHQVMIRADVLELTGGFDESLRHGAEDLDLWLRLFRRGYVFADAPYYDCFYRQRPGSMIEDKHAEHLDAALTMLRANPRGANPDEVDPGEATTARVVAERTASWCVAALVNGQPANALDSLRMLTPGELQALRSSVDLRIVARDSLRRTELRFDASGTNELSRWKPSVELIAAAVTVAAFGSDQQIPVIDQGA